MVGPVCSALWPHPATPSVGPPRSHAGLRHVLCPCLSFKSPKRGRGRCHTSGESQGAGTEATACARTLEGLFPPQRAHWVGKPPFAQGITRKRVFLSLSFRWREKISRETVTTGLYPMGIWGGACTSPVAHKSPVSRWRDKLPRASEILASDTPDILEPMIYPWDRSGDTRESRR